jgi:hypothetical protein
MVKNESAWWKMKAHSEKLKVYSGKLKVHG